MKDVVLKEAAEADCRDLWMWRNAPEVRKNFFDPRPVPWKKHEKWFASKFKDPGVRIYVASYRRDKIGVIRFEEEKGFISVSVNLSPRFLGKGLGSKVIRRGTDKFIKEARPACPILAGIKKGNIASKKAFRKAGYELTKEYKKKLIYQKL